MVDLHDLSRAILWYVKTFYLKPLSSLKTIFTYGKYPAISIHGKKIHIHRLLMMYWLQRELATEEDVHHKDENKKNALRDNLELTHETKHLSHHNKGRTLSDDHKQKLSIANQKRKGISHKKRVPIDIKELREMLRQHVSINKIAQHFKCDWSTINARIHDNPELLEPQP